MSDFYNIDEELLVVIDDVEFFRFVRRQIKDSYSAAKEFHLSINEKVIIEKLCKDYDKDIKDYYQTNKYFNDYITNLIRR